MTQDRFHSTRSAVSISPLGDQMSDVTTRADDRWARLTLLLWSQREITGASGQFWQDGRHDRTFNVLAPHLSTTEGSESLCQMGKLHEMSAKTLDGEARLLEGGEGSTRESFGEGGNGQKNRAFRSAPRRPRPRARVPTLEQMNDQLRNDQPNKTESGPGPASRTPTVTASSSTNDHLEEVLKGQAQQAEFLQHMWMQQSQMQQALQQQVCALTGAIQQLAETQQVPTAWTSEETRRKTS